MKYLNFLLTLFILSSTLYLSFAQEKDETPGTMAASELDSTQVDVTKPVPEDQNSEDEDHRDPDGDADETDVRPEEGKETLDPWDLPATMTDEFGIDFILVQPGKFLYENEYEEIEFPFYLQKTELTQSQWKTIIGSDTWKNSKEFRENPAEEGSSLPVVYVSFWDVQKFIGIVNSKAKNPAYRLPTQEEIAYAATAGAKVIGQTHDDISPYCWHSTNSDGMKKVGLKKPNAWGFHDLNGNVWEWTMERSDSIAEILPKLNEDDEPNARVKHGGSYMSDFTECTATSQQADMIDQREDDLGFRLVKYVVQENF